jgi:limonene-1,2-epoxide hydrolase
MTSPVEEVLAFFKEWEMDNDAFLAAVEKRFDADSIWENVGLATTTGFAEAKAFLDGFAATFNYVRAAVEVHHIAAHGNVVLTERNDRFYDAASSCVLDIRLMGVFEMEGGKIRKWRDYFDTVPFVKR